MTITLPKTNLPFCRNVCAVYDKQDMQLGVHCSCLMTIQPSLSGENLVNDGGPLALFFLRLVLWLRFRNVGNCHDWRPVSGTGLDP